MPTERKSLRREIDENATIRAILEGTSQETGLPFFRELVKNVCKALQMDGSWVTEYLPDLRRLRALAFWFKGDYVADYEYDIAGTPCETVIENACLTHFPNNIIDLFPGDPDMKKMGGVSYIGMPLLDTDRKILGHLAALDSRPMPDEPPVLAIFQIFASRAAAELRRIRAENELREREQKLSLLVDSAMDAIIELKSNFEISRVNPATEQVFKSESRQLPGRNFNDFLRPEDRQKLIGLVEELNSRPRGQQYLWIPGGLTVLCLNGSQFPAEATFSRFELGRQTFYTLIMRNVNERLTAEEKILSLTAETEYLREEIRDLQNFDEIIGRSKAIVQVLQDVQQVAATDSTVLILGETGTGKELVARAIHKASKRYNKPLVKVNCAAIPANLMESEFFGHEKGAFTGATTRREGRFSLANGGTIFLDEIGDLPVELQMKLLRVLQEGEFEPVGSSQTRKVDVRIITATNRNLLQEVRNGNFREDLYYRLNVFPVQVPPLRERPEDIPLLANRFTEKLARKIGRPVLPLSGEAIRRLQAYDWPGNVRELQNIIERAVITAREGKLNLDRALPELNSTSSDTIEKVHPAGDSIIYTAQEMQNMERENIILALEKTNWKVSGESGAASLLGLPPSTLSSRIKTLGIRRPR